MDELLLVVILQHIRIQGGCSRSVSALHTAGHTAEPLRLHQAVIQPHITIGDHEFTLK